MLDVTNPDHLLALAENMRREARHMYAASERTTRALVLDGATAVTALAERLKADAAPFGPGTLGVLLEAGSADPGAVCDAIEAVAGEEHGRAGVDARAGLVRYCLTGDTLAALVRALRGVAP